MPPKKGRFRIKTLANLISELTNSIQCSSAPTTITDPLTDTNSGF